jgi:hypothetical protein
MSACRDTRSNTTTTTTTCISTPSKHTHTPAQTTYAILEDLLTSLALRHGAVDQRARILLLDDAARVAAAAVVVLALAACRARLALHGTRLGEACAKRS